MHDPWRSTLGDVKPADEKTHCCGPGKGDHGLVIALRLLTPDSSL
jgi:hypothetical protein